MSSLSAKIRPVSGLSVKRLKRSCLWHCWRRLMLSCTTVKFKPDEDVPGQDEVSLRHLLSLGFVQKDIDRLWTLFMRIDMGERTLCASPSAYSVFQMLGR
jgi:hypothetical protein